MCTLLEGAGNHGRFSGQVAVVTGGSSGIGFATARLLSSAGAKLVLVGRDRARVDAAAEQLPGAAIGVAADVSVSADVDRYMSAALDRFGQVDLTFLNAGSAGAPSSLSDTSDDEFDRVIASNLRGAFLGLRAAIGHLRDSGRRGSIVLCSSTSGLSGSKFGSYSAAKHGVVGLAKAAANEGAPLGIRVNTIAPGAIETPMISGLESRLGGGERVRSALQATTPLGRAEQRYGRAEEVAATVAFLMSDDAGWITGAVLPVDGGVLAADPFHAATPAPED